MKIERVIPKPPPEFAMMFTRPEGWTLVMALNDAIAKYPRAVDRDKWIQWSKDLNDILLARS